MSFMVSSMRWFGPEDAVSLSDIAQAGATEVVTALHQIPVGEIWDVNSIEERKMLIENAGLKWSVVESLPVHSEIKLKTGNYKQWIANYIESLKNLSNQGIKVVTYNFMPLFDWIRTDTKYLLPNGAESLYFSRQDAIAFENRILQSKGHIPYYTEAECATAVSNFDNQSDLSKNKIYNSILLGFPGTSGSLELDTIKHAFQSYQNIDTEKYRSHLFCFLERIIPYAQEYGIKLAIHPDDPPYPIFGLPRVVSSFSDIEKILDVNKSDANGLCFCTGSLAVNPSNDLVRILQQFGDNIHFLHLRNIMRLPNGDFFESELLNGSVDMYEILLELCAISKRRKYIFPMRPDHGHKILDDFSKNTYPGYSAIGRLKSLAELRGIEFAISSSNK